MDKSFFASPIMRIIIFLWGIVFPIVFIGMPVAEMFNGERPYDMKPVWAAALWFLSPLVVGIVLKYMNEK